MFDYRREGLPVDFMDWQENMSRVFVQPGVD